MEITIDSIIGILGLLFGGGALGGIFTWRWQRAKAKAEAKEKEAEAKSAEVDMAQKVQDTYQEMLEYKQKEVDDNHRLIEELRADRDHYKQGYVEMRDEVEKLSKDFYEFKRDTEAERQKMKRDIARNTRIAESSRPFMCGLAPECAKCVPIIISDEGAVTPKEKTDADAAGTAADVEPIEKEAL
jgi:predicted nuclease with TOPRIM domain